MWICSFRKCDWDKLRETLHYAPWHVISTFDDIDDRWEIFQSILLDVLNSFAPLQRVSSRKSKRPAPWFNECIAAKIKAKNCSKRIATRSGSEEDKEAYHKIKKWTQGWHIRKATITYLRTAVSQARSNPKITAHMWKCVNSIIGHDKSHMTGLQQGASLDAINGFFFSQQQLALSIFLLRTIIFLQMRVSVTSLCLTRLIVLLFSPTCHLLMWENQQVQMICLLNFWRRLLVR